MKNEKHVPLDLTKIIIETDRLILRPIDDTFTEDIFLHFNSEITMYMNPKPAKSIDETKAFIKFALDELINGITLQLVIVKLNSNEFIGCAGLHDLHTNTPELGVWVKKDAHGFGYGFEAITALINWAKRSIHYEYLKYPVDKRNFASRRIPELNGGIVGKEYKKINQSGFELDEYEYWIYKNDEIN